MDRTDVNTPMTNTPAINRGTRADRSPVDVV
jgi:hypothetical protein